MIIGTAGHIDHGKTTLVRALTGVDTDRLPEEKRRGITIELGFAPLTLEGVGTVGVVDVPGHEAFVRTMVAGASGIDVALLVVAADEGVMPQTRRTPVHPRRCWARAPASSRSPSATWSTRTGSASSPPMFAMRCTARRSRAPRSSARQPRRAPASMTCVRR